MLSSYPYNRIIDILTNQKINDPKPLLEILSQINSFETMIISEVNFVERASEATHKEKHLELLLDLISIKPSAFMSFSIDHLESCIRSLSTYPTRLSAIRMYDKLLSASKILIDCLKAKTDSNHVENKLKLFKGPNSPIFYASLLELNLTFSNELASEIFESREPTIPNAMAFTRIYETRQAIELRDWLQPDFCDVFLKSDDDLVVLCGLRLVCAILKHQNNEQANAFYQAIELSLDKIVSKQPVGVSRVVAMLPVGTNQLGILRSACAKLGSFGTEYSKNFAKFVWERRDQPGLQEQLKALASESDCMMGVISLVIESGVFEKFPDLLNTIYPDPPTQVQIASIPVASKARMNTELFKAISRTFFYALENNDITIMNSIASFVPLYSSNTKTFISQAVRALSHVSINEVLSEFAQAIMRIKDKLTTETALSDSFVPFFYNVFSSKISDEEKYYLYKMINGEVSEIPKNAFEVVESFVPGPFLEPLKKLALKNKNILLAAALPNTSNFDIDPILEEMMDAEEFNSSLFVETYMTLAYRNQARAFSKLYSLSKSKRVVGSFILKRKKLRQVELRKVIMEIVARYSEFDIMSHEQLCLYNICEMVLQGEFSSFPKEAGKFSKIIPKLKDATPPKSLLDSLLPVPLFSELLPQLTKEMKPTDSQIETMIHSWAFHLTEVSIAREKNPEFVKMLFRFDQSPKSLKRIISIMETYINSKPDILPYLNFCHCATEVFKVLDNETIVTAVRALSPGVLSTVKEIRVEAAASITMLFQTTDEPNMEIELQMTEIIIKHISLFMRCFKIASKEICEQIQQNIAQSKFTLNESLLLNAMLASRTDVTHSISSILENGGIAKGKSRYYLIQGLSRFAKQNIEVFLPLLIGESPLRKQLVSSLDHTLLVNVFHVLAQRNNTPKTYILFQLLITMLDTYEDHTSDFAIYAVDLLIYAAVSLEGKLRNEISRCIDQLFLKSPISRKPAIAFSTSDFGHLMKSLTDYVEALLEVGPETSEKIQDLAINLLDNKSAYVRLVDAMFLVLYAGRLRNPKKIYQIIDKVFTAGDIRSVAAVAEQTRLRFEIFPQPDLIHIFVLLLDSLSRDDNTNRRAASRFLVSMIPYVPNISGYKDRMLALLRQTFKNPTGDSWEHELIVCYAKIHLDLGDFTNGKIPNLLTVLENPEIVQMLGQPEEMVSKIGAVAGLREIALIGIELIKRGDQWVEVASMFYERIKGSSEKEVIQFNEMLMNRLTALSISDSPYKEIALKGLSHVIK